MKKLLIAMVMVLASGCAQIGVKAPQSIGERIAYAYATETAVRNSAAQALLNGQITVGEAQQVLTATDQVRTGLDAARLLEGSDATAASSKLLLAIGVLTEVQKALLTKGVK